MADPDDYEAVLFDMDGVLLQGRGTLPVVYAKAADDALAELGVDPPEGERGPLRQSRFDEAMAERCRAVGIDPAEFWATRERLATEHAKRYIGSDPRVPFEDTDALAGLSLPLGVVSNNRAGTVEYTLGELFPDRFDVAIGREPTVAGYRKRKPDPYYLDRALDRLGVDHALYVGDRPKDLTAARRAGIDGALLRRAFNRDVELDDEMELDSLDELAALLD